MQVLVPMNNRGVTENSSFVLILVAWLLALIILSVTGTTGDQAAVCSGQEEATTVLVLLYQSLCC